MLVSALVRALSVVLPAASAAVTRPKPRVPRVSLLFVVDAGGGTLRQLPGHRVRPDARTAGASRSVVLRPPRPASSFADASLFIDDGTAPVINGCMIQPYTQCSGGKLQPNGTINNTDCED